MTEKKTAKDFARCGYVVRPAINGGFTVDLGDPRGERACFVAAFASFTNSTDLIAFLSKGHAEYDKELAA